MNVSELIAILQTMPQDAQVLFQHGGGVHEPLYRFEGIYQSEVTEIENITSDWVECIVNSNWIDFRLERIEDLNSHYGKTDKLAIGKKYTAVIFGDKDDK